jgi:hypothetical protein
LSNSPDNATPEGETPPTAEQYFDSGEQDTLLKSNFQLDPSFEITEASILPLSNNQRMLALELEPGLYVLRIKTPFFPLGGMNSCRSVKLKMQLAPQSMVSWKTGTSCKGMNSMNLDSTHVLS